MKTMTILNVLARASIGVTSTLFGVAVGKKVADSHDTVTAVAAASAATLVTYVAADAAFTDIQYMISKKSPDEDQVMTLFEDELASDEHTPEDSEEVSSDNIDRADDIALNAATLADDVDDESNTSADEAGNAPDGFDTEDEIKIVARKFLSQTGGDLSKAKAINASLLNECLDSLLKNPDLYKVSICEDDDRVYLSGPGVILIDEVASVALINPSGKCNWEGHDELRKLSDGKYFVTAGEVDSFGWVTGCINTPAGIIVYG